jgi:hypothetical protein
MTSLSRVSTLCDNIDVDGFPRAFGIYRTKGKEFHYVLVPTAKDPFPYFLVNTPHTFTYDERLTLHPGSNSAKPALASTKFRKSSKIQHITLGSTEWGASPTEELWREGYLYLVWHFSLYLPALGRREHFQWQYSGGPEIRAMGHYDGLRLVRESTEKVVAAFAYVKLSKTKKGKMQFMNEREDLGEEFWLMVFMSMLSILEGERRARMGSGTLR